MANSESKDRDILRLQSQVLNLSELLTSVQASLSDMSDPKLLSGIEKMLEAQEASLAELVEALNGKHIATALEALTKAVSEGARQQQKVDVSIPKQPAPVVNIQVKPTPITIEAAMPKQDPPVVNVNVPKDERPKKWRVRLAATQASPAREMTIEQM